jgi:hypothetical protein
MPIFTLVRRAETAFSTWGALSGPEGATVCKILERGARNSDHPRIAAGLYRLGHKPLGASHFDADFAALIGPAYRGVLWLPQVPGRSDIEIHTANFARQLLGCLASGEDITRDRDGDFAIPGGTSRRAYARLYPMLLAAIQGEGAQLQIHDIRKDRTWTI